MSDTVYNAPANLKSKVWNSPGETAWRKLRDANVSNITASTSKNTQDNDMDIKDFFPATTLRGPR